MSQIHTSYKVSKMLKEFLGESAPEALSWERYYADSENKEYIGTQRSADKNNDIPAYQLHDLLSKPFCEAMAKKTRKKCAIKFSVSHLGWLYSIDIHGKYWNGGMEAVEKALTEMMEGK